MTTGCSSTPPRCDDFGFRFTGSSDLYEASARRPSASVNFVTAHDGFTLRDLVSYDRKHNAANGEGNTDGSDDNRSWNHGVEGPADAPEIELLRRRQQKNLLVTLFTAQGVPMLLGGDEIGRTQRGNNNAYCQDNEVSWYHWDHADDDLLRFTRRLIALRRDHPVFRRRRWFQGRSIHGTDALDISWLRPDGSPMTHEDWLEEDAAAIGIFLNGDAMPSVDRRGEPITDDSYLLLLNPTADAIEWTLPGRPLGERWALELSTDETIRAGEDVVVEMAKVAARSAMVLRRIS